MRYHPGGFVPNAAAENKAEQYDESGYTKWDRQGNVIERRPLTADEITALTPLPPVPTADDRLAAATRALAALDNISAPVLPIDVLDILTDLRSALEA